MVQLECCPNQERIRSMSSSSEQLRRIGTLAGNAWTKEKLKTRVTLWSRTFNLLKQEFRKQCPMCRRVKSRMNSRRSNILIPKDPLMLIEMITNKKDRKRFAKYFNRDGGEDPFTCISYMRLVKSYGFDHIIFIGECYAEFFFRDCYGRVFEWDSMCNVLWSLGDYQSVVPKKSSTRRVILSVEYDGTVTEFEDASYGMSRFCLFLCCLNFYN